MRPRAHKRLDQVCQRIGRLKTMHARVASQDQIAVTAYETGEKSVAVTWTRRPRDVLRVAHRLRIVSVFSEPERPSSVRSKSELVLRKPSSTTSRGEPTAT